MPKFFERRAAAARILAASLPLSLASCGGSSPGTILDIPNAVAVADINNDGQPDIVVASAQIDQTGQTNPPGFAAVVLNNPSKVGTFQPTMRFQSNGAPSGLALGDLTGSGAIDIVVADFSKGGVSVLLETAPGSAHYDAAINLTGLGSPNDVQLADMSGSGHKDLVIADGTVGAGNLIIAPHDPANPGHFLSPSVTLPLPQRGIASAVGDLNGDGKLDVVITSFDTSGNNGTISIFMQDPGNPGQFLPRTDIASPGQPSQPVIADINGDGLPDIVVASQGPGTDGTGTAGATVLLQDPANPGTFLAPVTYAGAVGSLSVAVGDLDKDGHLDIVLASALPSGQGTFSILLQDPANPGTFKPGTALTGLGRPLSVALADFNGDGYLDIAAADGTGAVVYVQSTTTPGTFGAGTQVGG
jgi:hypothetical protein